MEEEEKGYYVSYWTVSSKIAAKGATVEVKWWMILKMKQLI